MPPVPKSQSIWLVVENPPHSEYEPRFPSLDDLKTEMKEALQTIVRAARSEAANTQFLSGGPSGEVEAGITETGKLRIVETAWARRARS